MEQLIEYIQYFALTIFGGFLGYFIRLFIEHHLAIDRNRDNIKITEFNKASATFRAIFVDVIFLLRQNIQTGEIVTHIITPKVLIIHEKAKILFEPFLPTSELSGFNEAWETYKDYENNYYEKLTKSPESIIKNDTDRNKDFSQYCLTHIEKLLSYAKPKIK